MNPDLAPSIKVARENKNGRLSFTLERSRGETYSSDRPSLYSHDSYPRGSVMRGRPRRRWITDWPSWEEARADLAELAKTDRHFKFEDLGEPSGSTHIPVDVATAGLPDGPDA